MKPDGWKLQAAVAALVALVALLWLRNCWGQNGQRSSRIHSYWDYKPINYGYKPQQQGLGLVSLSHDLGILTDIPEIVAI